MLKSPREGNLKKGKDEKWGRSHRGKKKKKRKQVDLHLLAFQREAPQLKNGKGKGHWKEKLKKAKPELGKKGGEIT